MLVGWVLRLGLHNLSCNSVAFGVLCCVQVEVVLHAAGAPKSPRTLSLTRQKVAINPVLHATCSGVPAEQLPSGALLQFQGRFHFFAYV